MWLNSTKKMLVAGGAALVLGGSGLGLAYAQQAPVAGTAAAWNDVVPGGPKMQAFIDALARRLGVSSDRLTQAITETRTELGIPEMGAGHMRGGMRGGVDLSVAAAAIGITPQQLKQELPGKSLAQVSEAHGKTAAAVATALKDAAAKRINEAVAAGRLTAEQAAQAKQQAAQHIDQQMTQVMPQPGQRHEGGKRGPGGHGRPGAPSPSPAPGGASGT